MAALPLSGWFRRTPTARAERAPRRPYRPILEALEDRLPPNNLTAVEPGLAGDSAVVAASGEEEITAGGLSDLSTLSDTPAPEAPGETTPPPETETETEDDAPLSITGVNGGSGATGTGFFTNDTTPRVLGSGAPGARFSVLADGQEAGSGEVTADGSWGLDLTTSLSVGAHSLQVRPEGGAAGDPVALTIDVTPPEVTLIAPRVVTGGAAALVVRVHDDNGPPVGVPFQVDVDLNGDGRFDGPGEAGHAAGTVAGEDTPATLPPGLGEGVYLLRARVTDFAGNEFVSAPVTMHTDLNAGFVGDPMLLELAEVGAADLDPAQRDALIFDNDGRVLVSARSITLDGLDGLRQGLEELGMRVIEVTPAQHMVSGYLPTEEIVRLPEVSDFSAVTAVPKPVRRVGSTTSQGDTVMLAAGFRVTQGVDGRGAKAGVLSDSVDQVDSNNDGVSGIAESQQTGDLPAAGVQVLRDNAQGATDEGRAMLEIITDVAPAAALAFHSTDTPQVFANGIAALVAAGSRSVVDDIGFLNSPFFNDGVIAQAADDAFAAGAAYFSAAGNDADTAWQAAWTGTTATVGGVNGTYNDLGGADVLQNFTLAQNGQVNISFQWDDAYLEGGSPQANFQVTTDLEVIITDNNGNLVQRFNANNANTDQALERVVFTNNTANTQFAMSFRLESGPAPTRLKWINFGDDIQAQGQGAPTTFGQPAARGAVAVGAVPWFDPNSAEPFTSLGGPLTFLFDRAGNRLGSPEIRNKPEIAAPDGTNTSFFGGDIPQDADNFPNFFGTSAAAPHAAGAAALLISQVPTVAPARLIQHLRDTARDVAAPGFDFLTGDGLIQLQPLPPDIGPQFALDVLDPNETSDRATEFGTLAGPQSVENLAIGRGLPGLPDYDWFRWTTGRAGVFTATIDVLEGGDLELRVFGLAGNTLVELGRASGDESLSASGFFGANQVVLVEVKGRNTAPGIMRQGRYDLTANL